MLVIYFINFAVHNNDNKKVYNAFNAAVIYFHSRLCKLSKLKLAYLFRNDNKMTVQNQNADMISIRVYSKICIFPTTDTSDIKIVLATSHVLHEFLIAHFPFSTYLHFEIRPE